MKPFKAIVAISINGVVGHEGGIPWYLPEDFKWFKQNTTNNIIVMGRKTYESIGKPLPNRINVVLTRQAIEIPGVEVIHDLKELSKWEDLGKEIWICGGAEIYKMALPYCSDLYLSRVNEEVKGDTYFPEFEPPFVPLKTLRKEDDFSIIHYTNPKVMPFNAARTN